MAKTKTKSSKASAAVGTKAPTTGMSFDSMLGKSTVKADDKKKKNDSPVIKLPKKLQKNLKNFLKHKAEVKASTGAMRQEETAILDHCKEVRDTQSLAGTPVSTYQVVGEGNSVKYITVDKFSVSQDEEVLAQIRETLGADADQVLEQKMVVTMRPEVFEDDKLKKDLVALLGPRFGDFFTSETKTVTKKGLNDRLHQIAGSAERLEDIRELIVQAKPSLR